jgi:hypothetical protein
MDSFQSSAYHLLLTIRQLLDLYFITPPQKNEGMKNRPLSVVSGQWQKTTDN